MAGERTCGSKESSDTPGARNYEGGNLGGGGSMREGSWGQRNRKGGLLGGGLPSGWSSCWTVTTLTRRGENAKRGQLLWEEGSLITGRDSNKKGKKCSGEKGGGNCQGGKRSLIKDLPVQKKKNPWVREMGWESNSPYLRKIRSI